jgi:hypothetical protein
VVEDVPAGRRAVRHLCADLVRSAVLTAGEILPGDDSGRVQGAKRVGQPVVVGPIRPARLRLEVRRERPGNKLPGQIAQLGGLGRAVQVLHGAGHDHRAGISPAGHLGADVLGRGRPEIIELHFEQDSSTRSSSGFSLAIVNALLVCPPPVISPCFVSNGGGRTT